MCKFAAIARNRQLTIDRLQSRLVLNLMPVVVSLCQDVLLRRLTPRPKFTEKQGRAPVTTLFPEGTGLVNVLIILQLGILYLL